MKFRSARSASASAFSFRRLEIFGECALAVLGKFFQAFVEHDAIFERCVHSLAVKWNDGVGGVADQRNLVFIEPWRATNRHK